MTTYRANSIESINELFDKEGDELARIGFRYPNLSVDNESPEGFKRTENTESAMNGTVLLSPDHEAARLGIELET